MKVRLPKGLELSISAILLVAAAAFLLLFRLGSLMHGQMAAAEQPLPSAHAALHTLWDRPLDAPYTLVQLAAAIVLPTSGITASRLPAVVLGGALLLIMYWLLGQWYGRRLAIFSILLLMSAPWFLHVARLATPDILYPLAAAGILALGVLWHKSERSRWLLPLTAVVLALTLYVPGGLWLALVLVVLRFRTMSGDSFKHRSVSAVSGLAWLILVLPLAHWLLRTHQLGDWLGWHGHWPGMTHYARSFGGVWLHIFAGHWHQPLYNVGGLAAINIAMTIGFLVGLYLYGEHVRAPRTRFLLLLWLVGTALIALPDGAQLSLLLPIVMVLITGGFGYLLHRWLKVFPRNPLARGFGMGLVLIVILFAVAYNVTNYFDAWPHNQQVEQTFSRRL